MATALTTSLVARSGGSDISAGMVGAANGDTLPAGPANYLHVKNGSGSPVTVTITEAASGPLGTALANYALSPPVPATTGDFIYGPFPQNPFGDGNGLVNFQYSAVTTVTVRALNIPG